MDRATMERWYSEDREQYEAALRNVDEKLAEVLPDGLAINRQDIAEVIFDYIGQLRDAYSLMENSKFPILLQEQVDQVRNKARAELAVLDRLIPIQGSPAELIPWDLSDTERIFYEGRTQPALSWARFVYAMGKQAKDTTNNDTAA